MIFATFRFVLILFFRIFGAFTFYCAKKRKKIALYNLNLCFPEKKYYEKKKILKESYVSLGRWLADFLLLRFYTNKNIDRYVKVKNLDYLQKALDSDKGVILSTAHFGSWELAAHFFALKGYKCLILYNPIKSPKWLEVLVKNNRGLSGNILVAKQNSLLTIYRHLKKGGIVTFLSDQHCLPADGRKVPLFGHNVWTHTAFIKLSLKTGAPIVPGFIFTKSVFRYEVEFFQTLYPEDFLKFKDSEYQMVLASNKTLEKAIFKSPGHWMWQHRRFKNL